MKQFIKEMKNALKELSSGSFDGKIKFSDFKESDYKEIILIFKEVANSFIFIKNLADNIGKGKYTTDIKLRSDEDIVFKSLIHMTKNLSEINDVVEAVAEGNLNVRLRLKGEDDLLANSINQMVNTLKSAAKQAKVIAQGDYRANIQPRSEKDELGIALQKMTETFRLASEVAESIANGNFEIGVKVKGKQDLLANSINKMVTGLKKLTAENDRQDWLKTGINGLYDKMKGDLDLTTLCGNIVKYISKYLNAQIGALYVFEEEKQELILTGSYAFSVRKDINDRFKIGEGFVGEAAYEKELILVADIPGDYTRIKSAIGDSLPKNIVLSPFLHEKRVRGVIELGFFNKPSSLEIELIKNVMESIAIAINSAKSRVKTIELLEETQSQAEELQSQQEELKRTNEELQSQQEELRQSNEELEEQTQLLKRSEERLKQQQEELIVSNEELEKKTESLKKQKTEIQEKNKVLDRTRIQIEKKAEELALASKYKSEFLANMSHELRTPLNSLLLLSGNLLNNKKGNLTEDQLEKLGIVNNSGSELLVLINEILDLSKIEAGKMDIVLTKIILTDLALSIESSFSHMASDKGLSFDINISEGLPDSIITDKKRLDQIMGNLISNAVKFTDKGAVTIKLKKPDEDSLISKAEANFENLIEISVSDTGIGIHLEKQKVIFEAFQQADGGTSRKFGGTGLGLSITREIVKLLKGIIKVESEYGKGSRFCIYLPFDENSFMEKTKEPVAANKDDANENVARQFLERIGRKTCGNLAEVPSIKDDRKSLKNEDKVVELQEIYWKIGDFYEITEFSRDLDKKHPSPRIQHEIRSQLNKLNKDGIIDKPGRAKYCINIDN